VEQNADKKAQDEGPEAVQIAAAKMQVQEFYEKQKEIQAQKQLEKDAEQAAKLAALYRNLTENNSATKVKQLFAQSYGEDDFETILQQVQQQTNPLVP
jgi:hypothetical protein